MKFCRFIPSDSAALKPDFAHYGLIEGHMISSGTPAGVGTLSAGDIVEVEMAGIGVLRNPVHAPQP